REGNVRLPQLVAGDTRIIERTDDTFGHTSAEVFQLFTQVPAPPARGQRPRRHILRSRPFIGLLIELGRPASRSGASAETRLAVTPPSVASAMPAAASRSG